MCEQHHTTGASSSGRTRVFGARYGGSNPSAPAKEIYRARCQAWYRALCYWKHPGQRDSNPQGLKVRKARERLCQLESQGGRRPPQRARAAQPHADIPLPQPRTLYEPDAPATSGSFRFSPQVSARPDQRNVATQIRWPKYRVEVIINPPICRYARQTRDAILRFCFVLGQQIVQIGGL